MCAQDFSGGKERLREIISRYWTTPERAEWALKTNVIPLSELREWMKDDEIEILGFAGAMIHDGRFRIEPPLPLQEYVGFEKTYYERCLRESPDGEWSDSRYTAGYDLVNVFAGLWRNPEVPRPILDELKSWLGRLYKAGDEEMRTCIVHATLEHLVEQKPIREFFSDWSRDTVLKVAYEEACLWPDGGGRTPLGKPPGSGR